MSPDLQLSTENFLELRVSKQDLCREHILFIRNLVSTELTTELPPMFKFINTFSNVNQDRIENFGQRSELLESKLEPIVVSIEIKLN